MDANNAAAAAVAGDNQAQVNQAPDGANNVNALGNVQVQQAPAANDNNNPNAPGQAQQVPGAPDNNQPQPNAAA